jgi:phthalate 4,5-dioxygenase
MLHEENELLTRTGPGTPAGELLRRYWQPVALAEELPIGSAPLPVRLMSEDLVLFRNESGQPGLLGIHCSHRGADLSYGRLEDGGLRCIYHGWLYDVDGHCLEQPGEPTGSTFHERIHQTAYPCVDRGGMILAYLGPGEPPPVPPYEFLVAPDDRRANTKILHECNYLQAFEGTFDPQHLLFLHKTFNASRGSSRAFANNEIATMEADDTNSGVRICRIRPVDEQTMFAKTTVYVVPNFGAFGNTANDDGYTVHWHVPIDDTHHWKYYVHFSREAPMDLEAVTRTRADAERTPDYRVIRNQANRYLQDRAEMASATYSGLGTVVMSQDVWATESIGPIQDRTVEHLSSSDRAIVAVRHALRRAIDDVQAGRTPPGLGARADGRIVVRERVMRRSEDWRTIWEGQPLASTHGH